MVASELYAIQQYTMRADASHHSHVLYPCRAMQPDPHQGCGTAARWLSCTRRWARMVAHADTHAGGLHAWASLSVSRMNEAAVQAASWHRSGYSIGSLLRPFSVILTRVEYRYRRFHPALYSTRVPWSHDRLIRTAICEHGTEYIRVLMPGRHAWNLFMYIDTRTYMHCA